MIYIYYLFWWMTSNPWGCAILMILAVLLGCCAMGVVDFAKKSKPLEPDHNDDIDLGETEDRIKEFLSSETTGEFNVSYFDGAFQIFMSPDQPIGDEELYKKLQSKFPRRVFGFHRTLHNVEA